MCIGLYCADFTQTASQPQPSQHELYPVNSQGKLSFLPIKEPNA
jgi:hypothetical protein